jgi:hypothetical protein
VPKFYTTVPVSTRRGTSHVHRKNFRQYFRFHMGKQRQFNCDLCGKNFGTRAFLNRQKKFQHDVYWCIVFHASVSGTREETEVSRTYFVKLFKTIFTQKFVVINYFAGFKNFGPQDELWVDQCFVFIRCLIIFYWIFRLFSFLLCFSCLLSVCALPGFYIWSFILRFVSMNKESIHKNVEFRKKSYILAQNDEKSFFAPNVGVLKRIWPQKWNLRPRKPLGTLLCCRNFYFRSNFAKG